MATVNVTPTADARMNSGVPDGNYGLGNVVPISTSSSLIEMLDFSAIPAGSTIDAVTITRERTTAGQGDGGVGTTITYTAQRCSRTNWTEGTGTTAPENPATSGVTHSQFNAALGSPAGDWTAPGGDLTGTTWTFTSQTGTGTINLTEAVAGNAVEIVQTALDSHAGLASLIWNRGTAGTAQQWATKDHATSAFRPVWSVNYTEPAPGGGGGVSAVFRHARVSRVSRK